MKSFQYFGLFLFLGVILLLGCSVEPEPQKIGVFAYTSEGLLEISPYKTDSPLTVAISDVEISQIPKVSSISSFSINLPEIQIAETKMFWVSSIKREEASYEKGKFYNKFSDSAQLKPDMESSKNGVYKIRCSELEGKKGGIAILHVRMPYGTTDRAYMLQLK